MDSITLHAHGVIIDTENNIKAQLNELATLAPTSLRRMEQDDRSVEELLRFIALCAAMRSALSAARAVAESRLSEIIFAPESLSGL